MPNSDKKRNADSSSHALLGWVDIDEAPRDGSEFLATGINLGTWIGRHIVIAKWINCHTYGGHFTDQTGSTHLCYLTHCMPLPSLPNADVEQPPGSGTPPTRKPI